MLACLTHDNSVTVHNEPPTSSIYRPSDRMMEGLGDCLEYHASEAHKMAEDGVIMTGNRLSAGTFAISRCDNWSSQNIYRHWTGVAALSELPQQSEEELQACRTEAVAYLEERYPETHRWIETRRFYAHSVCIPTW